MRLGGGQSHNSKLDDISGDQEAGSITPEPASGAVGLLAWLILMPGCACDKEALSYPIVHMRWEPVQWAQGPRLVLGQAISYLSHQSPVSDHRRCRWGETCHRAGCCVAPAVSEG